MHSFLYYNIVEDQRHTGRGSPLPAHLLILVFSLPECPERVPACDVVPYRNIEFAMMILWTWFVPS
jgi:hypothetical protein